MHCLVVQTCFLLPLLILGDPDCSEDSATRRKMDKYIRLTRYGDDKVQRHEPNQVSATRPSFGLRHLHHALHVVGLSVLNEELY